MMNFWFGEPGGVAWFIVLIILLLSVLAAPLLLSMRKRSIHTSLS
jgi:hypothetical protein